MLKKSFIKIIFFVFIFVTIFNVPLIDAQSNRYISVGLTTPLETDFNFTLSNELGFTIKSLEGEFQNLFKINLSSINLRLDSYYTIKDGKYNKVSGEDSPLIGPYHLEIEGDFENYSEAIVMVNNLKNNGIKGYPFYNGDFKVWVGHYVSEEKAGEDIEKVKSLVNRNIIIANSLNNVVVENDKSETILMVDKDEKVYFSEIDKDVESSVLKVGDYKYRGFITPGTEGGRIVPINYINLEKYLYGVVPREMSPSWAMEALKAQAVAARNFTVDKLGLHSSLGYDLCDTTHCQVYGGYDWENINSNKAVNETAERVLKYNGSLVSTFYHASSGGYTENSENVWTYEIPYLRGVYDPFSLDSPYSDWTLVLNKEDIRNKLLVKNIDIGDIKMIKPLSYTQSGRVLELLIEGSKENYILEKDKIRNILGYWDVKSTMFNSESDGDAYVISGNSEGPQKITLGEATVISGMGETVANRSVSRDRSNNVSLSNGEVIENLPVIPNQYTFRGSGWGHGLGLSQWGARRMAEEGFTYDEILEFYYSGTKVE